MRASRWASVALMVTFTIIGCSSKSDSGSTTSCEVGTEGCACYRNDTCDRGMICASNVCVRSGLAGTAGAPSTRTNTWTSTGGTSIGTSIAGWGNAGGGAGWTLLPSGGFGYAGDGSNGATARTGGGAGADPLGANPSTPSGGQSTGGGLHSDQMGGTVAVSGSGGIVSQAGGAPNAPGGATSASGAGGAPSQSGGAPNVAGASGATRSPTGGTAATLPTRSLTDDELTSVINAECSIWEPLARLTPPKLQLVVDATSSMSETAPGTALTRWQVTRDALLEAICGVNGPGLDAEVSLGLLLYPNLLLSSVSRTPISYTACINETAATRMAKLGPDETPAHRTLLRNAFGTVTLGRGTPTAAAYDYALNSVALAAEQQTVPGEVSMLLITDGPPTLFHDCYNPAGLFADIGAMEVVHLAESAALKGVRTFVIGLPGTEAVLGDLSKVAYAGGTHKAGCAPNASTGPYCHMDLTTAPDMSVALRDALSHVVSALPGCRIEIPPTMGDTVLPTNIERLIPVIRFGNGDNLMLGRVNVVEPGCTEGYRVISSTRIELCSNTCDRLHAAPAATIQLIFGCNAADLHAIELN